jgi:hypothetical protein
MLAGELSQLADDLAKIREKPRIRLRRVSK